jgi:hypothetical protein
MWCNSRSVIVLCFCSCIATVCIGGLSLNPLQADEVLILYRVYHHFYSTRSSGGVFSFYEGYTSFARSQVSS